MTKENEDIGLTVRTALVFSQLQNCRGKQILFKSLFYFLVLQYIF